MCSYDVPLTMCILRTALRSALAVAVCALRLAVCSLGLLFCSLPFAGYCFAVGLLPSAVLRPALCGLLFCGLFRWPDFWRSALTVCSRGLNNLGFSGTFLMGLPTGERLPRRSAQALLCVVAHRRESATASAAWEGWGTRTRLDLVAHRRETAHASDLGLGGGVMIACSPISLVTFW